MDGQMPFQAMRPFAGLPPAFRGPFAKSVFLFGKKHVSCIMHIVCRLAHVFRRPIADCRFPFATCLL